MSRHCCVIYQHRKNTYLLRNTFLNVFQYSFVRFQLRRRHWCHVWRQCINTDSKATERTFKCTGASAKHLSPATGGAESAAWAPLSRRSAQQRLTGQPPTLRELTLHYRRRRDSHPGPLCMKGGCVEGVLQALWPNSWSATVKRALQRLRLLSLFYRSPSPPTAFHRGPQAAQRRTRTLQGGGESNGETTGCHHHH